MSDDQDRFADETAPDVPVSLGPKAFPPEHWEHIPFDLRPEAADRAAWLVFRGESVKEALIVAMEGMRADLADLDIEPSWAIVRSLATVWPRLPRGIDGCYRREIMTMASLVETVARDQVLHGGGHGDIDETVPRFPTEEVRAQALLALEERSAELQQALLTLDTQD